MLRTSIIYRNMHEVWIYAPIFDISAFWEGFSHFTPPYAYATEIV